MISLLRRRLAAYTPSSIDRGESISASVLIPVFENGRGTHILLTKRTTMVKYHKGEVSFPGGMREKADGDTLETAMRECEEEIGVKGEDVEVVGRLDDMNTFTGFVITPYVGLIPYPYPFRLNPEEVAYLIYLPLAHLLKAPLQMEAVEFHGDAVQAPAFYYGGERIWGATCRILVQLKKIIEDDEKIQS